MKEAHTPPVSPARYAVTITYSAAEDRLLFYCGDNAEGVGLISLTRRITGNMIQGVVRILGNATPATSRVPHELKKQFLHFEHQSALSRAAINHNSDLPKQANSPNITFLVHEVNISQMSDSNYSIFWRGSQNNSITMTMSRLDLHCLIHVMQQHAQKCGWDLPPLPYWMQPGDSQPEHAALLS